MKTDYDELYRNFRQEGCAGWGGVSYKARLDTLKSALTHWKDRLQLAHSLTGLDLGCGTGDIVEDMRSFGWDSHGCDISSEAIAWAQSQFPHLQNLRAMDVLTESYEPGVFDVVFDGHTLHCFTGINRQAVFKKISQWLKPQGYLLINHMIGDPKYNFDYGEFDSANRLQLRHGKPYRHMPENENKLKRELQSFGFQFVQGYVSAGELWDCFHGVYTYNHSLS